MERGRIHGYPNCFEYPLLSQERVKLRTSNFVGTFIGSTGTKANENIENSGRGRSQRVPKIFRAPICRAHCAVIFAIAQLSCILLQQLIQLQLFKNSRFWHTVLHPRPEYRPSLVTSWTSCVRNNLSLYNHQFTCTVTLWCVDLMCWELVGWSTVIVGTSCQECTWTAACVWRSTITCGVITWVHWRSI